MTTFPPQGEGAVVPPGSLVTYPGDVMFDFSSLDKFDETEVGTSTGFQFTDEGLLLEADRNDNGGSLGDSYLFNAGAPATTFGQSAVFSVTFTYQLGFTTDFYMAFNWYEDAGLVGYGFKHDGSDEELQAVYSLAFDNNETTASLVSSGDLGTNVVYVGVAEFDHSREEIEWGVFELGNPGGLGSPTRIGSHTADVSGINSTTFGFASRGDVVDLQVVDTEPDGFQRGMLIRRAGWHTVSRPTMSV